MKKTILVPTDFSINAWVALQYAANMAIETEAELKIVHVFSQSKKNAKHQMDMLIAKLITQFPTIICNGLCQKGGLGEVIIQLLTNHPYALIIMGTKGVSGLKSVLMGSNALGIVNQASIPVLTIPENTNYQIQRVGLLSNYKNFEIDVMKKAIDILPSSFSLTLLHVRETENDDEELILESWKEVMKDKTRLKDNGVKLGIGSGVSSIVNTMVKEEKIDLLVATNNGRSFFKTLFNKNLIKTIAIRPQIPVLFIKV